MVFYERGKHMNVMFNFRQYVWIFAIGCYVGYAIEMLWCLIKNGYIESRSSLVLGHLSVAYGMGAVLLTLILIHFQSASWWKIFLIAFISGIISFTHPSPITPQKTEYGRQTRPLILSGK